MNPIRYTSLDLPEDVDSQYGLWLGQHDIYRLSTTFVPDYWFEDPWYLFGVDLFNQQAHWYAHEVWERKWIFYKKHHPNYAPGLQALIQLCAMMIKTKEDNARGAQLAFDKLWPKLQALQTNTDFLGLHIEDLMQMILTWKNHPTAHPTLTLKNSNESISRV